MIRSCPVCNKPLQLLINMPEYFVRGCIGHFYGRQRKRLPNGQKAKFPPHVREAIMKENPNLAWRLLQEDVKEGK